MHAAQGSQVLAQGIVDLHKTSIEACLGELAFAKETSEKTAIVFPLVELDHKSTRKRCRHKAHWPLTLSFSEARPSAGRDDGARCAIARTDRRRSPEPKTRARDSAPAALPCRWRVCIPAENWA